MRKLFPLLLLFVAITAWAGNVSQEEAMKKAQAFFLTRTHTHHPMRLAAKGTQMHRSAALDANTQESYYVFNAGEQHGFVVVSGDDRTPAILGYADAGAFDATSIPDNMKAWLQGYADQLAALTASGKDTVAVAREHQAIRPLLKTTWNQDTPYNNLCPLDNGERSATGCVAVAMAQIINYHKHPAMTTKTIPAYTTNTKKIKVGAIPSTAIDWDHLLNSYSGSETAAQKQAVANLQFLCGAAAEMDYTSNQGSAAPSSSAVKAMKTYFDYDDATRLIDRGDYRVAEWDDIIYSELASGRPLYYSGQSSGGGHAFVVDGYDKDGLYHVNWGWGGYCDGYFLLSILDPGSNSAIGASSSTDGYSYDQDAIVGAQPNTGVAYQPEVRLTTGGISTSQTTVTKHLGSFPVNYVSEVRNYMGDTYTFTLGTGVYDTDNHLVYSQTEHSVELDDTWGYSALEHSCNVPALPDGTYFITCISREKGTSTWYQNVNASKFFLTATISDNKMTLQNPTENLSGSISTTGSMEAGSKLTITATIENLGTFFNEVLFLMVDGEEKGARHFEVSGGETKTLEMTFYPEDAGEKTISIARKHWEYREDLQQWYTFYTDVATTTVTINPASSYSLQLSNGKVTNATNKKINDKVAVLSFSVKNYGTKTYNEDIRIFSLIKNTDNDYYGYAAINDVPVSLTALQSKQMQVEIPLLKDGSYWFSIVYKSDGKFKDVNDNTSLNLFTYQVVVPDEPDPVELSVENIQTAKQGQTIYNLNGQKVDKAKKGLYVVNGKKVVIK